MALRQLGLCAFFAIVAVSHGFYLPGVSPKQWQEGSQIPLHVNKIESVDTMLPYSYYSLDWCPVPKDSEWEEDENLGQILMGDRIEASPYKIEVLKDEKCKVLCRQEHNLENTNKIEQRIRENYKAYWEMDNLPVGEVLVATEEETIYSRGFHIGMVDNNVAYIFNHISITIKYHRNKDVYEGVRVVGFLVAPSSRKHEPKGEWNNKDQPSNSVKNDCDVSGFQPMDTANLRAASENKNTVIYTYDVFWVEDPNVAWATRWDAYLESTEDASIHWFSIVNSLLISVFLTGMVAMILMRTLHRDLLKYNEQDADDEDADEDTGWKLVHGDVFRPPVRPNLFAALLGTGAQVFGMCLVVMIFAVLGFLSPANRGGLMQAMLLLFVFMSVFAGYWSSRTYKMFRGTYWKRNTVMTATVFPGMVFTVFMVLNWCIGLSSKSNSSGYVSFGYLFSIALLWIGVSVPLVYLGSYLGFKKPAIEHPVRTNQIPRQVPEQVWYMKAPVTIMIGGILPFGAIFIELFFILSSIWLNRYYYVFGFLFLVFLIMIVTCAEITVVMCYFQLCAEDYHWWWRSFLTSGSSGLYLFLYSFVYYSKSLHISTALSTILYFGYMYIFSLFLFVLTGFIGFVACFAFVTHMYASVKID